jgi:AcrR family transcriptional regulator
VGTLYAVKRLYPNLEFRTLVSHDDTTPKARKRLSRDRVLRAAIAHADARGLEALTMRTLADLLEVAPMALYRHVANKDDLVDAMVDVVFSEVGVPLAGGDWKTSMRRRAIAVREALSRHPWAVGLMESRRSPGPANLRHHDAVIGRLRAAGFDVAMAAHAYSLLDSYIYGFALTKINLPFETSEDVGQVAETMLQPYPANEYPNLVEFLSDHVMKPGYDYGDEFDYGLNVILDGLERVRGGESTDAAGELGAERARRASDHAGRY